MQMSESLISLIVLPIPGDPTKRYLLTSGSGRTLYLFKVDTLLRCAAMPLFQLETGHQSTITAMVFFKLPDSTIYLATSSIDKHQGLFKLTLPQMGSSDVSVQNTRLQALKSGGCPGRRPEQTKFLG